MHSPKQPHASLQQASLPFLELCISATAQTTLCVCFYSRILLCVLTACLLISTALQHVTAVNTAGIRFLLLFF